ncbi:MAG: hypothetical protein ACOX8O_06425 [Christensenellales bacterium]|jgi:hypothetical protein|nr:hypothetical protein [Clostridiales bacterium]
MTRNTISENQMKKSKPPVHAGWQEWEDALLWEEVSRVRKAGKPLKSVFEAVSQATGRKANSIRNYYYSKVRERKESGDFSDSSMPEVTAFVPFQEHEVREVLKRVLCAQARGQSVRACTLEMGKGDNKAMLRYQNKYRSVIRNSPELVQSVMDELRAEGTPFVNPYEYSSSRGRKRMRKAEGVAESALRAAQDWEKVAPEASRELFAALGTMAGAVKNEENQRVQNEVQALKLQLSTQRRQYEDLREQNSLLASLLRQLIDINKDIIQENPENFRTQELQNYIERILCGMKEFSQAPAEKKDANDTIGIV